MILDLMQIIEDIFPVQTLFCNLNTCFPLKIKLYLHRKKINCVCTEDFKAKYAEFYDKSIAIKYIITISSLICMLVE